MSNRADWSLVTRGRKSKILYTSARPVQFSTVSRSILGETQAVRCAPTKMLIPCERDRSGLAVRGSLVPICLLPSRRVLPIGRLAGRLDLPGVRHPVFLSVLLLLRVRVRGLRCQSDTCGTRNASRTWETASAASLEAVRRRDLLAPLGVAATLRGSQVQGWQAARARRTRETASAAGLEAVRRRHLLAPLGVAAALRGSQVHGWQAARARRTWETASAAGLEAVRRRHLLAPLGVAAALRGSQVHGWQAAR